MQQRFAPLFCAAAAAFGISAIGCFALAQRVPFNPLEILWDPRQPAYLLAVYLLLAAALPVRRRLHLHGLLAVARHGRRASTASTSWAPARAASAIVALLFVLSPPDALAADRRAGLRRRGGRRGSNAAATGAGRRLR